MKKIFIFLLIFGLGKNIANSQIDSSIFGLDTMFQIIIRDTSDFMDSDYNDTTSWTAIVNKHCTFKTVPNGTKLNLCPNNPFTLIYLNEFDKSIDNDPFWRKVWGNVDGSPQQPCWSYTIMKDGKTITKSLEQSMWTKNENVYTATGSVGNENGNYMFIDTKYDPFIRYYRRFQTSPNDPVGPIADKDTKGQDHNTLNSIWPASTFNYTSGRIETVFAFPENIIVQARLKIPYHSQLWPAFWMLSMPDSPYNEFDIFEKMRKHKSESDYYNLEKNCNEINSLDYTETSELKITTHGGTPDVSKQCQEVLDAIDINKFHTWTFWYTDYSLAVFIDNKLVYNKHHYARQNRVGSFQCNIRESEARRERANYVKGIMNIIFNTSVYCSTIYNDPEFGQPNNTCLDKNPLAFQMVVDYLAVYQQHGCASKFEITDRKYLGLQEKLWNTLIANEILIDLPKKNAGASDFYDIPNDNGINFITSNSNGVYFKNIEISPTAQVETYFTKNTCANDFNSNDLFNDKNREKNPQTPDPITKKTNETFNFELNHNENKLKCFLPNKELIFHYEIYNVIGKLFFQGYLNKLNEFTINTLQLPAGWYFIRIQDPVTKMIQGKPIYINNN